ncbi:DUF2786 domain-containing protein [Streptantibioticus silvisoli]|uniref:DUF2786 domain-containing protein n=1 Tax=Streptantibioticus silvisoli TaxID=2705255 RepID=A0ABT6W130_9ACTN|nr:DUF2786 domain-containing protein [Streptantibioticus silvisoli]MDI5963408.1 DUF2786 domain-containing protein [Streptantibioticus silvisoli]
MDEFEQAYARALGAGGGEAEVDAAASVLAAGGDGWDAVAERTAGRVTRECAARGWGAADLVRMAGRELTVRHQRLAEELERGGALGEFARHERLDRFSAAGVLVELLCLYGRLPRITAPTPPRTAPAGEGSKVLGRIRALLAKAESTGFPEEAEALSAKAQQLMARHSIDEALLGADRPGGGPGTRRIGVDRPYEGPKALLLDAVASANRCETVWSADFGFSTVVGHEPDLDAVELLYTSLLVQADHALHRGPSRRRDFRESFLIAYAARIRDRLTAAAGAEVAARDDTDALLPALAARDLAVRDTTRRLFPATTTSRLKGRDAQGWQEGETAADGARL